jgi:signal peptidase II
MAPRPAGQQDTGSRRMGVARRRATILALAAAVVAADQVTKTWALHHAVEPKHVVWTLRLALTFNSGAAFGLGRGKTTAFVLGALALVVVLLGLGRRASRTASLTSVIAMGLLLGGALGNLTDRIIRHHHGSVIDFIDLQWWPVFNLADASITIGALLLVLTGLLHGSGHEPRPAATGSARPTGPRPSEAVETRPAGPSGSGGPTGSGGADDSGEAGDPGGPTGPP